MNKQIINLLIVLLFFCLICSVGAGNSSTHNYIPNDLYSDMDNVEIVYAESDGHFNIPLSDGSKGYCLEYMEKEAMKGDPFIVANTSYAINNQTGEDVSNLLKVYFIDYDGYKADPVVAQHMIWHFTDDFDGWRVNKTIINDIKLTSEYKKYPDTGTIRYNSTHNMGFKFNSLLSPYEHHQNYWSYDIFFKTIQDCIVNNTTMYNNTTNIYNNISNTYSNITNTYNNITNVYNNINNTYNNITNNNITNTYDNITNTYNNITNNNITNIYNNITNNNYTNINQSNISYENISITNITNQNINSNINNSTYYIINNGKNITLFVFNVIYGQGGYIYVSPSTSHHVNMMETGQNTWILSCIVILLFITVTIKIITMHRKK